MYLSIYVSFTPHLSHPGSVYALKYSVYSYILTCSRVRFTTACTALDWTARTTWATRVCREDYQRRQVGECADTWFKQISLLGQWSCSCPATCQRACVNQKTTDELTVLLFCDVHIDKGVTLNLLWCLCVICGFRDVEMYRLTLSRHHWHCCIYNCYHNNNQLRLAPSIPECTSYICWLEYWTFACNNSLFL